MIYYVSTTGNDCEAGTAQAPFRTINHAAAIAVAGDTVRVYGGVYREWIDPQNGGSSAQKPIVYEAVPGEHPVIKGSEIVTGWQKVSGSVWKAEVDNAVFGDWNPYVQKIEGDWMVQPDTWDLHLGDVYINGRSMYEASSVEDLYTAPIRHSGTQRPLRGYVEAILEPEYTVFRWRAEVGVDTTVIYGNFQQCDPNEAVIEINVRRSCFYPTQPGRNYITVRGFEIAHAACPFTPPTADQPGMVGPHWSKGWIIENNDLHHAKCSAISLGKDACTGNNECFRYRRKHSHYYQTEAVFKGLRAGWNRETVGSHIVRNNTIHDCGQNGIVGHMGGAFSRIEHNHIYNIGVKHEFHGHEIAGIKLHAAIDAILEGNNIHDCTRGTWLDWQAQGVRVTRNLYHSNQSCDLMIEVTHGPCMVDHNIFLSAFAFENAAQGTAFVHNIIAGNTRIQPVLNRETPYHMPHSTEIMGVAKTLGGDDRVYNNVLLGSYTSQHRLFTPMNSCFDGYETPESYAIRKQTEKDIFDLRQAVYIENNAYAGNASAFRAEKTFFRIDGAKADLKNDGNIWTLQLQVPEAWALAHCPPVTPGALGAPVFTEEAYENPDGTPIDFSRDYCGAFRGEAVLPGPFENLTAGCQTITVWKK